MAEAVLPALLEPLEPCGRERLARDFEWELGEDQHAQRPARHVNTLPEGIGAEQDRGPRIAEPPQQLIALPLSLYEQRPARPESPLPPLIRSQ